MWIALAVVGCGQVEPVLLSVSMPDCVYQGTNRMRAGEVALSLTLNGIADAGVLLVELTDGYDDLERYLEAPSSGLPPWGDVILELELSSAEGIDGVAGTRELQSGKYALVCVDDPGGPNETFRAATPIEVRPD